MYSVFVIVSIKAGGCVRSSFCDIVHGIYFSLAIQLPGKRELIDLL